MSKVPKIVKELAVCFLVVMAFIALVTSPPAWTVTLVLSLMILSALLTPVLWGAYRLARLILQL